MAPEALRRLSPAPLECRRPPESGSSDLVHSGMNTITHSDCVFGRGVVACPLKGVELCRGSARRGSSFLVLPSRYSTTSCVPVPTPGFETTLRPRGRPRKTAEHQ